MTVALFPNFPNQAMKCVSQFLFTVLLGTHVLAEDVPDPMLTALPADRLAQLTQGREREVALVFTESREFPIRRIHGVPARWESQLAGAGPVFRGVARPGEFYVFQLGVYALSDTEALQLNFSDLRGGKRRIPARALQGLNLGGIDHRGLPFQKSVRVVAGQLQPLWIGVVVPMDARGRYQGTARLRLTRDREVRVPVEITVEGAPMADGGESEARHLARLRWLDSTVGSEPTVTRPFVKVTTRGREIRVLGRELGLGEDGLPAAITSHFSDANTRIDAAGRPVLVAPMTFAVDAGNGPVTWRSRFGALKSDGLNATWTARSTAPGWRAETTGRLDYTGAGEVRVRLTAERGMDIQDIRLVVPYHDEAARYFMGLNRPGGVCPAEVKWQWNVARRQDCLWLGDVSAGLMLRFKDEDYLRPPVNIYYAFRPLRLPASWGNGGQGRITLSRVGEHEVEVQAGSGPRRVEAGATLDFVFELYLTPFRPLDTEQQWRTRFIHVGGPGRQAIDDAVAQTDPVHGPNVVNVHHASFYSPYINYPYSDASFPAFRELVQRAHDRQARLRVYYTTREITQNMPELFPLHGFNGEIILPGPGRDAKTLLHPKGPHPWLVENLREDFIPAWEATVGPPYAGLDLSVITTPDSRWSNFYLEGLRWLVDQSDFDGVYIDDTALDATSLRRARRILDRRPGRLIDLHTWNHFNEWAGFANNLTIYMEVLPYLDRLWLGEGFDASKVAPDFWLVEMSGLPFGLMAEMLDGVNPWRGLLFGETGRLPWSGDPRGVWKVWDEYGIQGTEFIPWFVADPPVRTGNADVLATTYRRAGRSFIALGSWANSEQSVRLRVDWNRLGLDPARARLFAPAIAGMQEERCWRPDEPIPVAPGRGWFLIVDEATPGR